MKVRKAIFPVAGLGTRFLPATKVLPKEMLPVIDKPVIQYALEEAQRAGIEEFIFVTGRGKVIIEDHFDVSYELEQRLIASNKNDYSEEIRKGMPDAGTAFFTRQQMPLGLGHAVLCAKAFIHNEPFAVILPDELFVEKDNSSCLKDMIKLYEQFEDEVMVIASQEVLRENVKSYGIFDVKESKDKFLVAKGIVEKPKVENAPSNYAVIGRYVLPYEIFDVLTNTKAGVGGEIQLTDAIASLMNSKQLLAYIFNGTRHDCGYPMGLLQASIETALKSPKYSEVIRSLLRKYSV